MPGTTGGRGRHITHPHESDPNAGYLDAHLSSDDDDGEDEGPLSVHELLDTQDVGAADAEWDPEDTVTVREDGASSHVDGIGRFVRHLLERTRERGEALPGNANGNINASEREHVQKKEVTFAAEDSTGNDSPGPASTANGAGDNAMLFYDPDIDDQNQEWMTNMRRSHNQSGKARTRKSNHAHGVSDGNVHKNGNVNNGSSNNNSNNNNNTSVVKSSKQSDDNNVTSQGKKRNGNVEQDAQALLKELTYSEGGTASDAVLTCPSCMVTLCIDCQRHEVYSDQFRAMFVMNVRVATTPSTHLLRWKLPETYSERYYAVACAECSTEVAAYDENEIFHFCNVLATRC